MRKTLLLLSAVLLVLSACKKNDDNTFENVLNYDGDNATAPFLPGGAHEAAARFTAAEVAEFVGRELIEVSFYISNLPQSCEIRIYDEGDRDAPGTLLYSASVSNSLSANSWNTHELVNPIAINGDDFWINIRVVPGGSQQSIGCDSGPADPNGDWILLSTGGSWETYRQLANESINWNIRGKVSAN